MIYPCYRGSRTVKSRDTDFSGMFFVQCAVQVVEFKGEVGEVLAYPSIPPDPEEANESSPFFVCASSTQSELADHV
jgi:hypothetical protein